MDPSTNGGCLDLSSYQLAENIIISIFIMTNGIIIMQDAFHYIPAFISIIICPLVASHVPSHLCHSMQLGLMHSGLIDREIITDYIFLNLRWPMDP